MWVIVQLKWVWIKCIGFVQNCAKLNCLKFVFCKLYKTDTHPFQNWIFIQTWYCLFFLINELLFFIRVILILIYLNGLVEQILNTVTCVLLWSVLSVWNDLFPTVSCSLWVDESVCFSFCVLPMWWILHYFTLKFHKFQMHLMIF